MDPPAETVLALDPAVRARLYAFLAPHSNNRQRRPRPLRAEMVDQTLAASGLPPSTTNLLRRLMYPKGPWMLFADDPLVLRRISDLEERRRFIALLATNF